MNAIDRPPRLRMEAALHILACPVVLVACSSHCFEVVGLPSCNIFKKLPGITRIPGYRGANRAVCGGRRVIIFSNSYCCIGTEASKAALLAC